MTIQLQDKTFVLIENYRDLDQQVKAISKEMEAIKKDLTSGYFANNHEYSWNGRLLASYTAQVRNDIDREALKKDHPELYEKYTKKTEFKVFRLK